MENFPGYIDPSHHRGSPGFYGTRAKLAATAKEAANGSVRVPQPGSSVGYGAAPTQSRTGGLAHSFYAPPPQPETQHFSSMRQTGLHPLQTQRINDAGPASANGTVVPHPTYGDKDLWTHPIVARGATSAPPAGGAYAGPSSTTRGAPNGGNFGATSSSGSFAYTQQQQGLSRTGGGSGAGLVDRAFVDGPNEWRYDARGVAMTKAVDLAQNTDPRGRYHIPGYGGFVRGKQFEHGETFGKTTRNCLDVPLDYPTDVDL